MIFRIQTIELRHRTSNRVVYLWQLSQGYYYCTKYPVEEPKPKKMSFIQVDEFSQEKGLELVEDEHEIRTGRHAIWP